MRSPRYTLAGGIEPFFCEYLNNFFDRGSLIVERLWTIPGVSEEFKSLLRQALPFNHHYLSDSEIKSDRWTLLPGLCCQAVGGVFEDADLIALAWLHFYLAAQLMDSVQDMDEPDPWWKAIGSSGALNVASGLFFFANLLLSELYHQNIPLNIAHQLTLAINQDLLLMCNGQYFDVINNTKSLGDYWRQADNKSGIFFALACKCGAILGDPSPDVVNKYRSFGYHLGMLIQILDDLEDWHTVLEKENDISIKNIPRSLPIVYTLEVLPVKEKIDFIHKLEALSKSPATFTEIINIVDRSGASIYIFSEMQKHFEGAQNALAESKGQVGAINMLEELLSSLLPEASEL